jgi:hypothetical protein
MQNPGELEQHFRHQVRVTLLKPLLVHRQQLNADGEMVLTFRSHASSVPPTLDPQLLHVGQIGASASGRKDSIVKGDVGVEGT